MAADSTPPQYATAVVAALRARNSQCGAACRVTHSCQALLAAHAELRRDVQRQQKRADLAGKEKHDMQADLALLRENEANAGVSRAHIEALQEQLELAKSQAERATREAVAAKARADASVETSENVAAKLSTVSDELLASRAEAAAQTSRSQAAEERVAALSAENARLLSKLMEAMEAQARAMEEEIVAHEARQRSAAETASGADDAAAAPADEPANGDGGTAAT